MNEQDEELYVGIQEATKTVCLNKGAIDAFVKNFNLNTLQHFNFMASKIAEENGYNPEDGWMLGTMNKEDADYITSFLIEDYEVVEFVTK